MWTAGHLYNNYLGKQRECETLSNVLLHGLLCIGALVVKLKPVSATCT